MPPLGGAGSGLGGQERVALEQHEIQPERAANVALHVAHIPLTKGEQKRDFIIVDGSPGIGCPVIASITGADLVLVVTEPTLSGKHDLERVAELMKNFGIETMVCINKYDINPEMSDLISEDARKKGLKVIGTIPYDEVFTKAQIMKATVIEYTCGDIADKVKALWREVVYALG